MAELSKIVEDLSKLTVLEAAELVLEANRELAEESIRGATVIREPLELRP